MAAITSPSGAARRPLLDERARAIALLAVVNAFVGGMLGLERTVLPLVAREEFGVASSAGALAFVGAFGLAKAAMNLLAGGLADRLGRRRLLVAGWLLALPVPFIILAAPSWGWIVAANLLLGLQQSLTWSMTLNMKLDLAGERRRGLVIGLNEFAGYAGMAFVALATGLLAERVGLREAPFALGIGLAGLGLGLSLVTAETKPGDGVRGGHGGLSHAPRDAHRRGAGATEGVSAASLAGLATNLKDGALWGLLPVVLHARALPLATIGLVTAAYPAAWSVTQLASGPLSDRLGRRPFVAGGMLVQAVGVWLLAVLAQPGPLVGAAVLVGVGTGLAYPTLMAFVADAVGAEARASALGIYRAWRDAGYVIGAFGAGAVADAAGAPAALSAAALVAALAAAVFAWQTRRMPTISPLTQTSGGTMMDTTTTLPPQAAPAADLDVSALRSAIRDEYALVATEPERGFHFHTGRAHAERLGYAATWLDGVPERAVTSFAGTGNPFTAGPLGPGEHVVDVGCGAGIDSFIAARMVGPGGAVVGVDMTPAMVAKAQAAATEAGLGHLSFREALAEALPVPDAWADVVISNGVLNLMPDKLAALAEMARALKPGGRLQVGDIAVDRPVPDDAKRDIDLWTG